MKILFISTDLGVKQYHMACAFTDVHGDECHFMNTYPSGINFSSALRCFPRPRRMALYLFYIRAFRAKYDFANSPFKSVQEYSAKRVRELDPDIVYFSSIAYEGMSNLSFSPLVCDVEDASIVAIGKNLDYKKMIENRSIFNDDVKLCLFGSDPERQICEDHYKPDKPFITAYPFVARRTLPLIEYHKTRDFSVVFLGSIFLKGYRNIVPHLERIAEDHLTQVYLSNSFRKEPMRTLKAIESRNRNFKVFPFETYGMIKESVTKFHVGVVGSLKGYKKTSITFGMKPLEYAYAGVQPCSLGNPLCNLSDGKEFGYVTTPETIKEDFKSNLYNFDFDYHMMDSHITRIRREFRACL